MSERAVAQPYMRPCAANFGIIVNRKFVPVKHNRRDAFQDSHGGEWKARDQIDWLLRKGNVILSGIGTTIMAELNMTFVRDEVTERQVKFLIYMREDAPDAYADLKSGMFVSVGTL